MRFSTFVFLPIAAVLAAPQAAAPSTPDLTQINQGVAEVQAAINKIMGARQVDAAAPVVDARDATSNTSADAGGQGIGSAFGDLETLLNGLSNTLTGVCNLKSDLSSLTSQLSSLGL
ncbi:hypothetical protein N0V82_001322 [Gnomoniopsis sp. IMI 355080]|nr:hypothetical protein N0V82_001322 [Gnomoniopsis sp. IMI 355080]